MDNDFQRRCEQAFADCVDRLYQDGRIETHSSGQGWVRAPVTGLFYRSGDASAAAVLEALDDRAAAAAVAFRTGGPAWAQPLPVAYDAIDRLAHAGDRRELIWHFAGSLFAAKYDFQGHVPFHDFCCGLMARSDTPGYLRNDAALRREFPPQGLPGLLSEPEEWVLRDVEARLG